MARDRNKFFKNRKSGAADGTLPDVSYTSLKKPEAINNPELLFRARVSYANVAMFAVFSVVTVALGVGTVGAAFALATIFAFGFGLYNHHKYKLANTSTENFVLETPRGSEATLKA